MKQNLIRTLPLTIAAMAVAIALAGAAPRPPQEGNTATPSPAASGQPGATVPRLITYSGTVKDASGKLHTGGTELTFALYEFQEGGSPLFVETQNLQLDEQGRYTVLLGATQAEGLPLDLFTLGKARWLGVTPQLPAVGEQPRVLLVGVPYALKAADAETLAGLPASAFVQAGTLASSGAVSSSGQSNAAQSSAQAAGQSSNAALSVSGSGTTNFIPIWTSSTNLGNSTISEVRGTVNVKGTLQLPATGTATATAGNNSQPASLQASAFNSSTKAAVNQTFNLQAEPTGNDTASPSGKLNLLFASGGGTPAETGLSIASNGQIKFATGQTFPGSGTITGVTTDAGSGLTGGGVAGMLSIGLQKTCSTSQVLQWNGSSWVCASAGKGTITGVTAGTDLTDGGTSGTVTLNLDTTKVPLLSGSNTFAVNQRFKGNGNSATIGDMGCGLGYVGLSLFPGGLNCTNYAILGDTFGNLYINRPTGGGLNFREGNGTELSISPGGAVTAFGNIAAASFTGDGSQLSNIA